MLWNDEAPARIRAMNDEQLDDCAREMAARTAKQFGLDFQVEYTQQLRELKIIRDGIPTPVQ